MRLGISGTLLPDDVRDLTPETARTLRSWGYTGVFTRLRGNDPLVPPSDADCRRFRDILGDAGLEHVMGTGYWQNLVHPDAETRKRSVQVLCAGLRLAAKLGAACIDTGPGSMSSAGPWSPHPDNWAPWAEANLIDSLGQAAEVAAQVGVRIHLEGHQLVTLRDEVVTRRVVDAVGSPWVRVDMDPVNWITLDTYYDTGAAIDEMFDTLGDRIGSGHSKDIDLCGTATRCTWTPSPPGRAPLITSATCSGWKRWTRTSTSWSKVARLRTRRACTPSWPSRQRRLV